MRLALAFAPGASPSYIPLGLGSIVAHLGEYCPSCDVSAVDLNAGLWHWLADRRADQGACRDFMCGAVGDFLDRNQYESHLPAWARLQNRVALLEQEALAFIEQGECNGDLREFLRSSSDSLLLNDPGIIGISAAYPAQVPFAVALARELRQVEGARVRASARPLIVLGGSAMSLVRAGELVASCPFVDCVIEGEGEEAVRALADGCPPAQVQGAWYRDERPVKGGAPQNVRGLIPVPSFDQVLGARHFVPVPVLPIQLGRRCAWAKCQFCAHNSSYGGRRTTMPHRFVETLAKLSSRHGTPYAYLADQSVEPGQAAAIARAVIAGGHLLRFHLMCRPTSRFTPELLELLFRAGCRWISWGVESGSQRLLDRCGKGTEVGAIKGVLRDAAAQGISNLVMLIFGLPGSTDQDFDATFSFLEGTSPWVDAYTASAFQLFDGTGFAEAPGQYGVEVLGAEVMFRCGGNEVRGRRLVCRGAGPDPMAAGPARSAAEVSRWKARMGWVRQTTLYDRACAEHYLIHASSRFDGSRVVRVGPAGSSLLA